MISPRFILPNHRNSFLILASAMLFAAGQAAEEKFVLPQEQIQLKSGPGLELVQGQCILCHSLDYISTQPKLTTVQWKATVNKMLAKYGAPVNTNSLEKLVDYLTTNYGRPTPKP